MASTTTTVIVRGAELNDDHVLVGSAGGRSQVYGNAPSSANPGLQAVETEHGVLYLDPDGGYEVKSSGPHA